MAAPAIDGGLPVKRDVAYPILALAVLGIAVPIGIAVFVLGFVYGDSPCVMCWEQRIGMALVALIGLFILRFGARPKYIGLAVLVGAWGVFMALRHTALHAARDIGQGFSIEILGAHTYTWAFVIFWTCIATMGGLLFMVRPRHVEVQVRTLGPLESIAGTVFLFVIAANAVQAFASTGPPPFVGQSDPIRFSFNPRHWTWSLDEWKPTPVSLRGRWSIAKPGVAGLPTDPGAGPFANLPALNVKRTFELALPLRGTPTDLAHDAATDRFLVTTEQGVYIADASLGRVLRYTVVDPGFSVDLGRFAGAAFLGPDTVMALGENKSYVVLREDDRPNVSENFRYFTESFDRFSEASRSRLSTIRARMMYTMSLAYDPAGQSLFTITVPNAKVKRLVVSRFDRRDMTLSEEFLPAVAPASGLALSPKRSVDEFYVTGSAVADGRLYALSAAYSTLLTIDPVSRQIVAAHAVPGLRRTVGMAVRGQQIYVLGDDRTVVIADRPPALPRPQPAEPAPAQP